MFLDLKITGLGKSNNTLCYFQITLNSCYLLFVICYLKFPINFCYLLFESIFVIWKCSNNTPAKQVQDTAKNMTTLEGGPKIHQNALFGARVISRYFKKRVISRYLMLFDKSVICYLLFEFK